MANIVLLTTETKLAGLIQDRLGRLGYFLTILPDTDLALKQCSEGRFSLCILNLSSFGSEGFQMIQTIRSKDLHIPVLFLLPKQLVSDKNIGFQYDGDDCLTLPLDMDDFLLHVGLLLNRSRIARVNFASNGTEIPIGSYSFSPDKRLLKLGEKVINLTKKEVCVLDLLHAHRNSLIRREKILLKGWGKVDYFMGRSMDVYITRLRHYLKEDESVQIKNIHGVGYVLSVEE